MTFDEALESFRKAEVPEDALPLAGRAKETTALRAVALAWTRMTVRRTAPSGVAPTEVGALWEWLWSQAAYDASRLYALTGLREGLTGRFELLRGLRLLYPDGTLHGFAQKALRSHLKSELGL